MSRYGRDPDDVRLEIATIVGEQGAVADVLAELEENLEARGDA